MLAHYMVGDPQAPLVVLVHGVTGSATTWTDLIQHLSSSYCIAAIDMLGHGLSPRYNEHTLVSPGDAGAVALEETLNYLVKTHGKKAILIGHSMGGSLSSSVASKRPELVSGLILEDPAWSSPEQKAAYQTHTDEYLSYAKRVWQRNPIATLTQNVEERGLSTPDFEQPGSDGSHGWSVPAHHGWAFAKPLVDVNLIATGITAVSQPWQEIARALTIPTVVITSDGADIIIGHRGAAEIAALGNPHITVEFIAGVGHNIRHSAPAEYAAIVDRYLAQWR
ncbi:MAG: alpha/beta hydrolase [Arcanobacterium sp.]|nr:alpha/beta hydrolase [Arcanobacterium sp.]